MDVSIQEIKVLGENLDSSLLSVDLLAVEAILTRPYPRISANDLVERLVVPVLDRIGSGWESGKVSLSQVYMSGRICEEVVDLILPPTHIKRLSQPKMAIVTLEDYHVLGKRIVYSTLRASGFELENYGRMDGEELAEHVIRDQVKILLVSVLMLPSALRVKDLRAQLDRSGTAVKIVVGGAPFRFDHQLWREVGADAFGETATEAVEIIKRIIEEIS